MALQNKIQQRHAMAAHWLSKIVLMASVFCSACVVAPPSRAVHTSAMATAASTAKVTWQISQTHTTTDINLPIKYSQKAGGQKIIVKLNSARRQESDITPEHYLTIVISCAGNLVKASTFTSFPLGSEGRFIVALPQVGACFKPSEKTAVLNIKLQLQLANPGTSLTLQGEVFTEQN